MSHIVGIDLGTTNSCVSVKGSLKSGYKPKGIDGYTIITNEDNHRFTPSVVFYDEKDQKIIVGRRAKDRIDGNYPPIMFAKKHLGAEKKFLVSPDREIDPVEASTEILKYLKNMVENQLGENIGRAVVTVPAYFSLLQNQLTEVAMKNAGFEVDETSIIQEPVAAALCYTRKLPDEDFKIMVYDLGGGTFDITILEKEGGIIEVRAFGGDPAFGGYNFDQKVADWIIKELKKEYTLEIDVENNKDPIHKEDPIRYTKLLLLAERTKEDLSDEGEVEISKKGIFTDHKGIPVNLNLEMSRDEFEGLIEGDIDYSISLCTETLKKSGFTVEDLDEILLVGGSSRIPLIKKKLHETFGKKPKIFLPDLAVSLGAAIYAGNLGKVVMGDVKLFLDTFPASTADSDVVISGMVKNKEGDPLDAEHVLEIVSETSGEQISEKLNENGKFYVEMPLSTDNSNIIMLRVKDTTGVQKVESQIEIIHSSTADDEVDQAEIVTGIVNLPKTIYVKKVDGRAPLASEGVNLPFEATLEFKIFKEGENARDMEIEIYEMDDPLGMIRITDIPDELKSDDPIILKINIQPDSQILIHANLPTINREAKAVFKSRILIVKSAVDLMADYQELLNEWTHLDLALNDDIRMKYKIKIERLLSRVKSMLDMVAPDTTEVTKILAAVQELIRDASEHNPLSLDPSKSKFDQLCNQVESIIKEGEKKSAEVAQSNYSILLANHKQQGLNAYNQCDQPQWHESYTQIRKIGEQIEMIIRPPQDQDAPPPQQLLLMLKMEMLKIKQNVEMKKTDSRYEKWKSKIQIIENRISDLEQIRTEEELQEPLHSLIRSEFIPFVEELEKSGGRIVIGIK